MCIRIALPERNVGMRGKISIILVFAAFLVMPTILYGVTYDHVDHENRENREYASFPEWSKANYRELPKGIEDYYNDRVPFKNQFKSFRTVIDQTFQKYESRYAWINMTPMVLQGKEGWLFYMPSVPEENAVNDYLGLNRYTQEEMARSAEKFQQLSDYYTKQGIQFVFLVAPGKESIYTDKMPDYYPSRVNKSRFEEFVEYLQENTTIHAVYPRDYIHDMRDVCDLYYKKDSHWNMAGAYLAVKSALDLINDKPMPELPEVDPEVTGVRSGGDLTDILGITGKDTEDEMIELEKLAPGVVVEENEERHSVSNAADQRKCLILGDSFSSRAYDVMKYLFGEVWVARGTGRFKEIVNNEGYDPDIIIWEVAERYDGRMEWPDILLGQNSREEEAEGFDAR